MEGLNDCGSPLLRRTVGDVNVNRPRERARGFRAGSKSAGEPIRPRSNDADGERAWEILRTEPEPMNEAEDGDT